MRWSELRAEILRVLREKTQATDSDRNASYEADEILFRIAGIGTEDRLLRNAEEAGADEVQACLSVAKKRSEGEPLAYLLREVSFFGDDYFICPGCLIPRADTEVLVEEILSALPYGGTLLDLCTGSGCVPCAVLRNRSDARAFAVEQYSEPLKTAFENRRRLSLESRLTICRGDVLQGMVPDNCCPDLICANPPYIPSPVCGTLDREVRMEPREALDGGEDGLLFYRAILSQYEPVLPPDGCFLFEIGFDQADALRDISSSFGFECTVRQDYAGRDRVVRLKRVDSRTRTESCNERRTAVEKG
ncbi:MAG: peptide chain release factor N(5)-glutamine methyltransferase [Clostridia bacterium]|nr:peptide chain release factor N(5)-glutamine methyltransferase [Clostridia bacterium]MBQ4290687.1 peptide chain release factor N(5)-glutamine methyltransferase [Clostridia bacterium]